jgi:hypothetical protein
MTAPVAEVDITVNAPNISTVISVPGIQGAPGVFSSILGTAHQVGVAISGSGGSIATLSTPQNIDTSSSPTFAALTAAGTITAALFAGSGASLTLIPNASLVHSAVTVGSTSIALGSSATTIAGLTSVTSTTFVGALTGNATTSTTSTSSTTSTNVGGGAAGSIPVQTAASATSFIAAGTNGKVLTMVSGVPAWAVPATGVASITGTANQIAASASTGAVTLSMPQNVIIPTPSSGIALTASVSAGIVANFSSTSPSSNSEIAVTAAGNTAGTTSLSLLQDGSSQAFIYNRANAALSIGTNNTGRVSITNTGNVTINAPSSGVALFVTGTAGTAAIIDSASGSSGLTWRRAGSSIGDIGSGDFIVSGGLAADFGLTARAGSLVLGTNSTTRLTIANGGAVSIVAPASGNTLTVNQTTANNGLQVSSTAGVQASIGIQQSGQTSWAIYQPISSSDLRFFSGAGDHLVLSSAGNVIINAPSSGTALSVLGVGSTITANLQTNEARLRLTSTAASSNAWEVMSGGGNVITAGTFGIFNASAGTVPFSVTGGGNVSIAAPSSGVALTVSGSASSNIFEITDGTNTTSLQSSGGTHFFGTLTNSTFSLMTNNSARMTISGAGATSFAAGVSATSFVVSSDRELKDNVRLIVNAEEIVQSLNGVRFDWKATGKPSVGLIAQDVEVLLPELVETNKETGFKGVNYDAIIGVLIEEVKALRKEVNNLRGG